MRYSKTTIRSLGLSHDPEPNEYRGPYQRELPDLVWVSLQPFLESAGYKLRPRFHRQWQPSWNQARRWIPWKKTDPKLYEDHKAVSFSHWTVLDATRTTDGQKVVLKIVGENEAHIASYLSSDALRADPRNHCIPLLDMLQVSETALFKIMIMPFLRQFEQTPFHCRAEVVDAFKQILEAVEFIHDHNIAHGDLSSFNIVMDCSQIVTVEDHFPCESEFTTGASVHRAEVSYYLIDFGLSSWFVDGHRKLVTGVCDPSKAAPELTDALSYDPFKVDTVQLGHALHAVISGYHGLEFLNPLLEKMMSITPDDRPTASKALEELEKLVSAVDESYLAEWINVRILS